MLKNVLILGKCAYFGKWRISHLRYSLYRIDSSIRIGLFVSNFPKFFSDLKNVSSIGCAYFGKCAYLFCAYYEWRLNVKNSAFKFIRAIVLIQHFFEITVYGKNVVVYYQGFVMYPASLRLELILKIEGSPITTRYFVLCLTSEQRENLLISNCCVLLTKSLSSVMVIAPS